MVITFRFPVSSICFSLRLPEASTTLSKGPFAVHCLPDAFETFLSKKKKKETFFSVEMTSVELNSTGFSPDSLPFFFCYLFFLAPPPSLTWKCWNPSEFWSTDSSISLTPSPELVILQIKYKGIYFPYFPFSWALLLLWTMEFYISLSSWRVLLDVNWCIAHVNNSKTALTLTPMNILLLP